VTQPRPPLFRPTNHYFIQWHFHVEVNECRGWTAEKRGKETWGGYEPRGYDNTTAEQISVSVWHYVMDAWKI